MNGEVRTAASPLVVETANRAGLKETHPPQAPEGAVRGPQTRLETANKPTAHPPGAIGVCGRLMAASATGLTAIRPPGG